MIDIERRTQIEINRGFAFLEQQERQQQVQAALASPSGLPYLEGERVDWRAIRRLNYSFIQRQGKSWQWMDGCMEGVITKRKDQATGGGYKVWQEGLRPRFDVGDLSSYRESWSGVELDGEEHATERRRERRRRRWQAALAVRFAHWEEPTVASVTRIDPDQLKERVCVSQFSPG